VGKNISFLAASASRAAIHKTFAVHENLADITAKTGSQCILGSMLGTTLGITTAALMGDSYAHTFAAFSTFTALSLGATYMSLTNVTLPSLSLRRLDYILQQRVSSDTVVKSAAGATETTDKDHGNTLTNSKIPTPSDLRKAEVLLGAPFIGLPCLSVGSDLNVAVRSAEELQMLLGLFREDKYILSVRGRPGASGGNTAATIHLLLKENATKKDILLGLVHAYVVRAALLERGIVKAPQNMSAVMWDFVVQRTKCSPDNKICTSKGSTNPPKLDQTIIKDLLWSTHTQLYSGRPGVVPVGPQIVQEILDSPWLVEELLLETRYARLATD
jgi:Vitamin B6 photo-protection and homoeostasis